MTERKKPGVAFWAAVVVVAALVLYPLSFGPACWISSRLNLGAKLVPIIYRPVLRITYPDPWVTRNNRVQILVLGYTRLFAAPGWGWQYNAESGHIWGRSRRKVVIRGRSVETGPAGVVAK
jgi:hypothetical protein